MQYIDAVAVDVHKNQRCLSQIVFKMRPKI